jgi:hypothetical protein
MATADTLAGAWYMARHATDPVVLLSIALAAYGARDVWQKFPEARTAILGIALNLACGVADSTDVEPVFHDIG